MFVAVDASMRMHGGRFQLVRRIGEDVDHKQRIAVKQLHVLDADALYRFKQEFRSAADIAHPNIVGLKELFSADGHYSLGRALVQAGEPAHVTRAAKLAGELGARDTAWAKCLGLVLDAGVAARRSERDRALGLLGTAATELRAIDMTMHANACDHVQGRALGGETGRQLVAAAESWMSAHDVADPEALASSFVPGFATEN